jgi:hypothetical protein
MKGSVALTDDERVQQEGRLEGRPSQSQDDYWSYFVVSLSIVNCSIPHALSEGRLFASPS